MNQFVKLLFITNFKNFLTSVKIMWDFAANKDFTGLAPQSGLTKGPRVAHG